MTPLSCNPETPAWELVRRSYRRRHAMWRFVRVAACAVAVAAVFAASWYAAVMGAIYYL